MSNYTKATNFTAKDSLSAGDVGKIIKGSEIDNEFIAIASAVASKANSNSPAFTGIPTAPTASVGTNTTQLATTAYVFGERANTITLTNKTINLSNNTLTGTVAQFNTALSDGNFTTLTGTETLTNKTLSSPALTGTPTSTTAAAGTNTTQVATTAFVTNERAATATLTNKTINGSNNTITNVSLSGGVTGTLPVANGGTGVTSKTGTGSVVLSNSPTLTGSPVLPTGSIATTQSTTDDSTKLATTAFVKDILETYVYPVGSIYSNATNSANPATLLGFGTWISFGEGRVLVGEGTGGGATYTAGSTGGSKDAIVPTHNHSAGTLATDSQGAHQHTSVSGRGASTAGTSQGFFAGLQGGFTGSFNATTNSAGAHVHSLSGSTANAGVSATDKNLQPYVVVYMWRRTA